VTDSVLQGIPLTVPIGGLSSLVMFGRYRNYKSNQLMGVKPRES
jgi:hypothetical protein